MAGKKVKKGRILKNESAIEGQLPGRRAAVAITMTTSSAEVTGRFHARRRYRYFLLLAPFLCATLGFMYYVVATKNNKDLTWTPRLISALRGMGIATSNESNLELALPTSTTMQPYPKTGTDDEVILVDARKKSMKDLIVEATASVGNIPPSPYILGQDKDGPQYLHNSTCARFPTIDHLKFNNIYWQTLRTSNRSLYLYSAYFDIRTLNLLGPTLRIMAMMSGREANVTTYCQIWFQGKKEPVISKVVDYTIVWNRAWDGSRKDAFHPFLLACPIPQSHQNGTVPASVSLVEQPCDAATNNLRVLFNKPAKKKSFGVCVKVLYYVDEDISARLVEWIELLGILGSDKIFIYEHSLHPNSTKVLRYYHQIGRIVFTSLMLPGSEPNEGRIRHVYLRKNMQEMGLYELLTINDCLYRNLYNYEYIAVVDIDEVIMPTKGAGWKELMQEVDRKSRLINNNNSMSSYSFRQLHFVDDVSQGHMLFPGIPKYLYMLQNVYRSPNIEASGDGAKCFHNPERVLTVHHHFPLACLNNSCRNYVVETDLAVMRHYRRDCLLGLKNCRKKEYRESTLLDTTIWRYKNELIDRSRQVLGTLGFIPGFKAANITTTY